MGDCNPARHQELVKILAEGKQRLAAIDGTRDGLSYEEQAANDNLIGTVKCIDRNFKILVVLAQYLHWFREYFTLVFSCSM